MQSITTVKAENFKGRNFSVALAPVSVLVADNYAHKTAVTTAIRLGLTGWLPPPIGKTPGSIYKLAGNQDAAGRVGVMLETSTGRKVRMAWEKDEKGRVSCSGGVPIDLAMPELLMEPRQFFGKTGAEQVRLIFEACDIRASGFGADSIRSRLVSINENPATVCEATLDEAEKLIARCFDGSQSLQAASATVQQRAKDFQKQANDTARQKAGAFEAFRTKLQGIRPKDLTAESALKRSELATSQTKLRAPDVSKARFIVDNANTQLETLARRCEGTGGSLMSALETSVNEIESALAKLPVVAPYDAREDLEELRGDLTGKTVERQDIEKSIGESEAELAAVEKFKLCAKCTAKIVKPTKSRLIVLRKSKQTLDKDIQSLTDGIAQHEAKETAWSLYQEDKAVLSAAKRLVSERDAAQREIDGAGKPDPLALEQVAGLELRIGQLDREQAAFTTYQNDLARRNELEQEQLANQCRAAVWKAVAAIVTEEQGKVAEFAFNEVLRVARHFTDGLLNSPMEFRNGELGRRISQLDVDRGSCAPVGAWVSHETFSGTEQALCYIGFAVALCKSAPIKLVIVDDVIISPHRKAEMVQRFATLVTDGVIDQALIVDVSADWMPNTGSDGDLVRVIKLSE